jgi:S1-C subfamily serine protease
VVARKLAARPVVPLCGVLSGLAAVCLGCLALIAIRPKRQKGMWMAVVGVLLGIGDVVGWGLFLNGGLVAARGSIELVDTEPPDPEDVKDYPPVIRRAMRANVALIRRGGLFQGYTIGSGVILQIAGGEALLITNRHVVDPDFKDEGEDDGEGRPDDLTVEVRMIGQESATGRVVWLAPGGVDLALVRVACRTAEARAAKWQLGRRVQVGDTVFAIGQPLGNAWTYTRGPVSQFRHRWLAHRRLRIIQTQTSLNPGNSGGGLYDREGFLIGINTWAVDKRVGEGLNFSISLEALRALAPPGLDLEAGSREPDRP